MKFAAESLWASRLLVTEWNSRVLPLRHTQYLFQPCFLAKSMVVFLFKIHFLTDKKPAFLMAPTHLKRPARLPEDPLGSASPLVSVRSSPDRP